MADDYNVIVTYENASADVVFTITDEEAGSAIDLTSYSATCHLRSGSPESQGEIVLEISTGNSLLEIDGEDGTVTMSLSASDLDRESVPASDYWSELILTSPGGTVDVAGVFVWQHLATRIGEA